MTDDELLALIEREEANCISHYASVLSEQRRKAMDYYYGKPYGNEVEGRSAVVTTEVREAVEDILPALVSIFMHSDEIVRFEAQNPNDEEAAQQATDFAHWVFSRVNNGFLSLYCLFKDALLQKNGYCKVYWEDYEDHAQETYQGLNALDMQILSQDPELELVNSTQYPDPNAQPIPGVDQVAPVLFDAIFKRTKKHGRICIDPCPPEEILVSREAPNELGKARFVEHRTLKSISELRKMGYDVTDEIADYAPQADFNLERVARMSYDDALAYRFDEAQADKTMRQVWLCEAYIKTDFDGDGIAELRKVTKVGKTILDNVEFDSLPVIGGTAVLMPHKHYGLSLYDLMGEYQLLKSTVVRQLLDNAYVANNGRMEVLDGMVNMSDLLTARPNGIVRVKALGAVKRIDNPLLGAPFYNLLDYLDKSIAKRIGATGFPNAVDPDAINAKAAYHDNLKEAAMERVNLMARILAEGPVKEIFWKIIELYSKHQDKPLMAKLRGKWVQVDPREWKNKFDMQVTVGIGTGSQTQVLNGAMAVMNIQAGMAQNGLMGVTLSPENVYSAAKEVAKVFFPRKAELFFSKPGDLPPPQPEPNIDLMKVQVAAQKAAMGNKQKYDKMMLDYQLAMKAMGIEVAGMLNQNVQQARDMQHEHVQNSLDRGMDHAMHKDDLHHETRMSLQEQKQEETANAAAADVSPNTAMMAVAQALQNVQQSQAEGSMAQAQAIQQGQAALAQGLQELSQAHGASNQMNAQAMSELAAALHALANKPSPRGYKAVRDEKGNLSGSEAVY